MREAGVTHEGRFRKGDVLSGVLSSSKGLSLVLSFVEVKSCRELIRQALLLSRSRRIARSGG